MSTSRREALRRLGHPRFRAVCQNCGHYVAALVRAYIWDAGTAPNGIRPVQVCAPCKDKVLDQNTQGVVRRVNDEVGLQQANDEYFESMKRSSDHEYLLACERMRAEGW